MLLDNLRKDLEDAQKSKNELAVSTLRMVLSSIHNLQIEKGKDLSAEEIISQIAREVKKHNESIEAFKVANRDELVSKEQSEKAILEKYLPQQLSDEELQKIVEETVSEVGASGMADFGKVMGAAMKKVGAGADGNRVSALVRAKLSS